MSYLRVIPRDLFNEAKLLKCLGALALYIHDYVRWPLTMVYDDPDKSGFKIDQADDGDLVCLNFQVFLPCNDRPRLLNLHSGLNSRENYPLLLTTWTEDEIEVFDIDGNLSKDFVMWLDLVVFTHNHCWPGKKCWQDDRPCPCGGTPASLKHFRNP